MFRLGLIWVGLFATAEAMDVLTTWVGQTRGTVESMPVSIAIMNDGGVALFIFVKFTLVFAIAVAILLTFLWSRRGRRSAGKVYTYILLMTRITTATLTVVALHNAELLQSL